MLSTDAMEWAGMDMTRRAASKAFELAGITPSAVQVIELHDCFSANEVSGIMLYIDNDLRHRVLVADIRCSWAYCTRKSTHTDRLGG